MKSIMTPLAADARRMLLERDQAQLNPTIGSGLPASERHGKALTTGGVIEAGCNSVSTGRQRAEIEAHILADNFCGRPP